MSYRVRKVIAIVIFLIMIFGWVITITGIGPIQPLKDRFALGLDIKGGVYVVMEANEEDIKERLRMAGFEYDEELNQFR